MVPAGARSRLAIVPLIALVLMLIMAGAVQADQPAPAGEGWQAAPRPAATSYAPPASLATDFYAWRQTEARSTKAAQQAQTCAQIRFDDVTEQEVGLIGTEADLVGESDGSRLCLYFDYRWGSYSAWTLSPRSIEEFRRTKAQLQPLLVEFGIDPCDVAFWSSFSDAVRRRITLRDRYDAGTRCPVDVYSHGPAGAVRTADVERALLDAAVKAEQVFDWELRWPLRVHIYDTHDDLVAGVRAEGGDDTATSEELRGVRAVTKVLANGGFGYLLDSSGFPETIDLRMLVAHEFAHVAQSGLLGDTDRLPFFVVEGGAEFFASLVVGPEQFNLAERFREAVEDERAGEAIPLSELIDTPIPSDRTRRAAAYSRGYAAMRFLTSRWGGDSYGRLHREHVSGGPERFIMAMSGVTGLSLADFDRELRGYLLGQPLSLPQPMSGTATTPAPTTVPPPTTAAPPLGRSVLAPNSLLAELRTGRPLTANSAVDAERFTRTDTVVLILYSWACPAQPARPQIRLIGPDRQEFVRADLSPELPCGRLLAAPEFRLDQTFNGRTARSMPGTWTAEIHANGALQGSITFFVE